MMIGILHSLLHYRSNLQILLHKLDQIMYSVYILDYISNISFDLLNIMYSY